MARKKKAKQKKVVARWRKWKKRLKELFPEWNVIDEQVKMMSKTSKSLEEAVHRYFWSQEQYKKENRNRRVDDDVMDDESSNDEDIVVPPEPRPKRPKPPVRRSRHVQQPSPAISAESRSSSDNSNKEMMDILPAFEDEEEEKEAENEEPMAMDVEKDEAQDAKPSIASVEPSLEFNLPESIPETEEPSQAIEEEEDSNQNPPLRQNELSPQNHEEETKRTEMTEDAAEDSMEEPKAPLIIYFTPQDDAEELEDEEMILFHGEKYSYMEVNRLKEKHTPQKVFNVFQRQFKMEDGGYDPIIYLVNYRSYMEDGNGALVSIDKHMEEKCHILKDRHGVKASDPFKLVFQTDYTVLINMKSPESMRDSDWKFKASFTKTTRIKDLVAYLVKKIEVVKTESGAVPINTIRKVQNPSTGANFFPNSFDRLLNGALTGMYGNQGTNKKALNELLVIYD